MANAPIQTQQPQRQVAAQQPLPPRLDTEARGIVARRLKQEIPSLQRDLLLAKKALARGDVEAAVERLAGVQERLAGLSRLPQTVGQTVQGIARAQADVREAARAAKGREVLSAAGKLTAAAGALQRGLEAALAKNRSREDSPDR